MIMKWETTNSINEIVAGFDDMLKEKIASIQKIKTEYHRLLEDDGRIRAELDFNNELSLMRPDDFDLTLSKPTNNANCAESLEKIKNFKLENQSIIEKIEQEITTLNALKRKYLE